MKRNEIYLGDCLELMPKHVEDKSIDMIFCDLPYGTTQNKWDSVIPLDELWNEYKRVIKDNGSIVLFGSEPFTSNLIMSNPKHFKYSWFWIKNRTTNYLNAKKQPLRACETVNIFYKKQPTFNPIPFSDVEYSHRSNKESKGTENYNGHTVKTSVIKKKPTSAKDVLFFNTVHPDSEEYLGHSTQKPLSLIEYMIKTYTNEGDLILDNTCGSGTTGLGAKNLNRDYIMMEQDPEYYEIACKRVLT